MLDNNTQYKDRTYVIDSSDEELFIKMKSIVDCGFPEALDPMLLDIYKTCWEKKKKIAYTELGPNTIYIHFPPIHPLMRFFGGIFLRLNRLVSRE